MKILLLSLSLAALPTAVHAAYVKTGTVNFLQVYSSAGCSSGIAATAAFWNKEFCVVDSPYAQHAIGSHRVACVRVDNSANTLNILYVDAGC